MKILDRLIERYDPPLGGLLHSSWWTYVLAPTKDPGYTSKWALIDRWNVIRCRWRGHPAGVVFYNTYGLEPDMTCKGCGDYVG